MINFQYKFLFIFDHFRAIDSLNEILQTKF